jgi:ribokinase
LLNFVEILFLNKDEAKALWGTDKANPGAHVSVITDGERGGRVNVEGKVSVFEGIKVKKVVDTTGAGDAFASGMVAGVLYGKTYEQAVKWGVKNATNVLKYIGAKKGLLTLGEINR